MPSLSNRSRLCADLRETPGTVPGARDRRLQGGSRNMSKTKCLLAMVALLAAMGTVSAQEAAPQWGYIEGGCIDFDPDEGLSDDGFFAGGSIPIFKMFHIVAEYDEVGDYSFWNAGFGWHGLFGDPLDLFAEVTWTDVEFDSDYERFLGRRLQVLRGPPLDARPALRAQGHGHAGRARPGRQRHDVRGRGAVLPDGEPPRARRVVGDRRRRHRCASSLAGTSAGNSPPHRGTSGRPSEEGGPVFSGRWWRTS